FTKQSERGARSGETSAFSAARPTRAMNLRESGESPAMQRIMLWPVVLLVTFVFQFGPGLSAHADPIRATYSTTGTIGTTQLIGPPNLSFQGVSSGTLVTGQPFTLGEFIVTPPPQRAASAYGAPFQVTLLVTGASGDPALPGLTPITLRGTVSGQSV